MEKCTIPADALKDSISKHLDWLTRPHEFESHFMICSTTDVLHKDLTEPVMINLIELKETHALRNDCYNRPRLDHNLNFEEFLEQNKKKKKS